ncbi:hypothetical protein ABZW47_02595 [Streptomyces sp. NPDC004549]
MRTGADLPGAHDRGAPADATGRPPLPHAAIPTPPLPQHATVTTRASTT